MSGNKSAIVLSLLFWLFLWGETASAQSSEGVVLSAERDQYPLGPHIEILEDPEGTWTIEDVTSPEIAAQFVPSQEEAPGFGFTDSAIWARIHVRNESDPATQWLLLFDTDAFFVDYYLPSGDGHGYEVVQTGSALPFHTRDVPVNHFVFRLPIPLHDSETIYMRFASEGTLILSLSIWSEDAFFQNAITDQAINSFLYGVIFILAVYNLILFFNLRDGVYLFYTLFFGTMLLGIMGLDSFGDQYLWPNWGFLAAAADRFFILLSFVFALLFATSFLRTKEHTPRLHRILLATAIAMVILLGLQFIWFRETALAHIFLVLTGSLCMIIAGALIWRKGYPPARYYMLGWLVMIIGLVIFVLTLVDVLPWTRISDDILRLGLVILALVLSIGLASRINIYRKEKEVAQQAFATQRTHIAQDLHDSVTQSLYSANLFAEAGRETADAGDVQGASHYFSRIGDTTQQALKEMRLFLYELRPPDVVDDGLAEALQKRLDTVEKRAGMEARLLIEGTINFPDDVNDQFYRISQEALNNVVKHAQAEEVTVYLRGGNGTMGLQIVDNGRGFELDQVAEKGGMGLKTMQERAAQIKARFNINTAPKQGTTIQVEVDRSDE